MNTTLYSVLKLLHFLGMAVWIGGGLVEPLGMKKIFASGSARAAEKLAHMERATVFIVGAAMLTVLSGVGLIFGYGGFSVVPVRIWIGAGLAAGIFGVGAGFSRPLFAELSRHFSSGGEYAAVAGRVDRLAFLLNLETAMRLVVLALMVFRF